MTYRDDIDLAVPRCPRCLTPTQVERAGRKDRRWYCTGCSFVFVGSSDEHAAEARRRAIADPDRNRRRRDAS